MTWIPLCLMLAIACLTMFLSAGTTFLGRENPRPVICANAKMPSTKNLRDLNFEYKAGKVPDADYASLKTSLQDEAATILAEISRLESIAPAARKREFERNQILKSPMHVIGRDSGILIALVVLFTSFAAAQTLTGTVKNSTTGKPPPVTKLSCLSWARAWKKPAAPRPTPRANSVFKLDDAQAPHLVRAIHQEVTYHRMAPPGTTSVEVEVYDAAKKIDGIEVVADIMRIQAAQGQIAITANSGCRTRRSLRALR